MALKQISDLPQKASLLLTDVLPTDDLSRDTWKVSGQNIVDLANGNIQITQSQVTNLSSDLSSKLSLSGGTMSGNLILNADPSSALQAATKQYVDGVGTSVVIVSGTSQSMSPNTRYYNFNVSLTSYTLPLSANTGDVMRIIGFGSGLWRVLCNSGQLIHFGDVDLTPTTGILSATNRYDSCELHCVATNTEFVVLSVQGNLTFT